MKIAYNWLREFLAIDADLKTHTDLLTDIGLEVEGTEEFSSIQGGLEGIVVGHVTECKKHPNADRLKLTKVDLGEKSVQIVCGAPNVAKGQKVPVATVGSILYPSSGEPLKIKKGKIRGEVSEGMICAEDELGLGESHDGIMVLDKNSKPGTPLSELVEIYHDSIIEIGLTPNRCDAMSHMGVARDLRAGLSINSDKEIGELITPSVSSFHIDARSLQIQVDVHQPELAPHYAGVTLAGLKVQESPAHIKNRLKALGITPINNVVDATNYVMHELGQPLHAFDANAIVGQKIEVKTLPSGTVFKTLDGEERKLHEEDLMICDVEKPLCIAGVYGGLNSGVTEQTTSIFLESAYFNPVSIRKTAKRHNLKTDASFRFERGVDPEMVKYALKRTALLIQEMAGGEIAMDIVDFYPQTVEEKQVFLPFKQIDNLVGEILDRDKIKEILGLLDIQMNNVTEAGLGFTIPAYRHDVTRPVDVIEEILRIYGYNEIDIPSKITSSIVPRPELDNLKLKNLVSDQLAALGFNEIMNNSLISDKQIEDEDTAVSMLNPLSSDLSVMRQSLLPGVLESMAYNLNRRQADLKFFEFGRSYFRNGQNFEEREELVMALTGKNFPETWNAPDSKTDIYHLKGQVTYVLERMGISKKLEKVVDAAYLSQAIEISNKNTLAVIGQINRDTLTAYGIDQPVYFAQIFWDEVLKEINVHPKHITNLPKFQPVERDLAMLVDDSTKFIDLKKTAESLKIKTLRSVNLFDVYEGKNLPSGKKSYALRFGLLDEKKTMTDKQIDKIMQKIQAALEKAHGAELRA